MNASRAEALKQKQANRPSDQSWTICPKKDKFQVPKVHEFQFYDDFEAVLSLVKSITKKIENFEIVPEQSK